MKANNRPQKERLREKIAKLETKYWDSRGTTPGNPYVRCKECGVRDPELSIRKGRHFGDCSKAGLLKQIEYYKSILRIVSSDG